MPVSKVLSRLAYLGELPSPLIGREVRVPLACVEQHYCFNNQRELLSLFEADSCLVHLGIIDHASVMSILTSTFE
jgi:hypothetical protein